MRAVAVLVGMGVVVLAAPAHADEAEEEKPCEPACRPGEVCFKATCMVPAPPRAPAPAQQPAYPPSYQYPPPGYPPPGYPPPGYPPPPPVARPPRRGFLAMPYVGINSFSGDGTSSLDPGLRLGAILGGRVSDVFSPAGELTIDILNVDAPADSDVFEAMLHMTFSPLFHVGTTGPEIVLGPKLGLWALWAHVSTPYSSGDVTEQGWTIGANAGMFFPVGEGTTSLGILLSYANLQVSRVCVTTAGGPEQCTSDINGSVDELGLTFAALF